LWRIPNDERDEKMKEIKRASKNQAERLFEIMVKATETGCSPFYPPEIMEIWHKGRSAESMAEVIEKSEFYYLQDEGRIRGFVSVNDNELLGLFVHPDDHRKGYGKELFHFGADKIPKRPVIINATLNAVSFYSKLGCLKVKIESVRRHDHDIYVHRMELD